MPTEFPPMDRGWTRLKKLIARMKRDIANNQHCNQCGATGNAKYIWVSEGISQNALQYRPGGTQCTTHKKSNNKPGQPDRHYDLFGDTVHCKWINKLRADKKR